MTFDEEGAAVFSLRLDLPTLQELKPDQNLHLRWIAGDHIPFLEWHRENVFRPGW